MSSFMKFDTFATSAIVMVLFWTVCAVSALSVTVVFISALLTKGLGSALVAGFGSIVDAAFAIAVSRVLCEGVIVIFKIHEELKKANRI